MDWHFDCRGFFYYRLFETMLNLANFFVVVLFCLIIFLDGSIYVYIYDYGISYLITGSNCMPFLGVSNPD